MAHLLLDQVTKQFSKSLHPAVCDVSLCLEQGEVLGLLGPSGCGKTTLLRLIAGFEQPQAGNISLAGQVIASVGLCMPPERRSVGMVFQDFALFPHLTAAENIAFGLPQSGKVAVQERVAEAIALVGLKGREDCYPHELSGGQQQRVALARALAPRPALLLLDEPLSNLDVQVRLYLRQEVREILKATGTTAIFVTHDQEEAMAIADRVGVMCQGNLEQLDTPEAVYQEPASRFVAEFVTQANFLSAQQQGEIWETEIGQFAQTQVKCTCKADWELCKGEAANGDLMIRQEDLIPQLDRDGCLTVGDRQFLGREYSYCLITRSGRRLQSRTSTRITIPVGATVRVSVVSQKLRFFPTQSSSRPRELAAPSGLPRHP